MLFILPDPRILSPKEVQGSLEEGELGQYIFDQTLNHELSYSISRIQNLNSVDTQIQNQTPTSATNEVGTIPATTKIYRSAN